ncbi:putative nuclease HARBI1 [Carcharodon carcharias]|uniref:putative nuclease HARBI1 n=1 Tax=Carcharodon carcharias TaxID=13397 RepID=UPI001B7F007F|nr:putative nuclease HARBI1 [Carcharodon carcharias]
MSAALKVALNFYALGLFQGSVRNLCGVLQSAVHSCIKLVTDALFGRVNTFIHDKTGEGCQAERARSFTAVAGFPWIQGSFDCKHVPIKAPVGESGAFEWKGVPLLNVQIVYDHKHEILQVCARYPGSCHDAYILRHSQMPRLFIAPAWLDGWLLGDKEYPLKRWLMTPRGHLWMPVKERYKRSHASSRAIIEKTVGLLKMRFHCLDCSGRSLQYLLENISLMVVVCCTFHILGLSRTEQMEDEGSDVLPEAAEDESSAESEEEPSQRQSDEEDLAMRMFMEAGETREALIQWSFQ